MFREKPAKNTVNMVGDGDDVDIVLDIEKTFGIQITEAEAEKIRTVGELYDLVCSKVDLEANGICLSGRAFRILRDASFAMPKSVRPSTPISELRGDISEKGWCRTMSKRSGLDFDLSEWDAPVAWVNLALIVCPPIMAWISWNEAGVRGLFWLFLWLLLPLFHFAPTRLPLNIVTTADLVRRSMGCNYARLKDSGGNGNHADIWLTVCGITRDTTGHEGPIDRNTTFFEADAQ